MRTFFALILIVFLGFALIACSGEKKADETQQVEPQMKTTSVEADSMAGQAVCAACGMEMNKADMVAYETEEGDTLHFCNEKCQEMYMAKMEEETTD